MNGPSSITVRCCNGDPQVACTQNTGTDNESPSQGYHCHPATPQGKMNLPE